jgi:hypothetical protein
MAISDYLVKGSYSWINDTRYSKQHKNISCTLVIKIPDGSIFEKNFSVTGINTIPELYELRKDEVLEDVIKDDSVNYVSLNHSSYPDLFIRWNSITNSWDRYPMIYANNPFYVKSTDSYVKYDTPSNKFVPCEWFDDSRIWEKYFSETSSEAGFLVKNMYKLLMSLDRFNGCKEA